MRPTPILVVLLILSLLCNAVGVVVWHQDRQRCQQFKTNVMNHIPVQYLDAVKVSDF